MSLSQKAGFYWLCLFALPLFAAKKEFQLGLDTQVTVEQKKGRARLWLNGERELHFEDQLRKVVAPKNGPLEQNPERPLSFLFAITDKALYSINHRGKTFQLYRLTKPGQGTVKVQRLSVRDKWIEVPMFLIELDNVAATTTRYRTLVYQPFQEEFNRKVLNLEGESLSRMKSPLKVNFNPETYHLDLELATSVKAAIEGYSLESVFNELILKAQNNRDYDYFVHNKTRKFFDQAGSENLDEVEKLKAKMIENNYLKEFKSFRLTAQEKTAIANDPIVGDLLKLYTQGSFVITGESGQGKTYTLREKLLPALNDGMFSDRLSFKGALIVNAIGLTSNTRFRGEFAERLKNITALARGGYDIIFEEMHTLKGSGTHSQSSIDGMQMLKEALSEDGMRIIGTTTSDEYAQFIQGDPAFARRVPRYTLPSLTKEKVLEAIIATIRSSGIVVHGGELEVAEQIYRLADEFPIEGAFPGKATYLAESAINEARTRGINARLTVKDAYTQAANSIGHSMDYVDPKRRKQKLKQVERQIMSELNVAESLKYRFIKGVNQWMTQTSPHQGAAFSFALPGPPGVGKSYTVAQLAKILDVPLVEIKLSNYNEFNARSLTRHIATKITTRPYSILFFDEFSETSASVQKLLLKVLDEGKLTAEVSSGPGGAVVTREIPLRHTAFAFAFNAGQVEIKEAFLDFYRDNKSLPLREFESKLSERLSSSDLRTLLHDKYGFPTSVLSRMDVVAPQFPPHPSVFREVAKNKIKEWIARNKKAHGIEVTVANQKEFLNFVKSEFYYPGIDFRILDTLISTQVGEQISSLVANGKSGKVTIRVNVGGINCAGYFGTRVKSIGFQ